MTTSIVDYALMAANAYQSTTNPVNWIPLLEGDGWQLLDDVELRHREDSASGFEATAYQNGNNEIVISFAGTGSAVDWGPISF